MVNIQEKISALCPAATFEEADRLVVTVEEKHWHALAKALKDDADLQFDMLSAVVGMDWKDAFGVMYYLTSTATWQMIAVKVIAADRENPMSHTVSDIWGVANFQEREVYDFFGIKFINHPDMRRFFLRNDWVGYPLRKDYDANPEINPIRLEPEVNEDDTFSIVEDENGNLTKVEKKVFGKDEYVVNFGPQHPSTHGVMRLRASLNGEIIKKVDVMSGYIHRGIEKLCEGMTYPQTLFFPDRMDYMSAHQNRH